MTLAPYTYHGLDFKTQGKNAIADCPFCGKEQHFSVAPKTGEFICSVCGKKGNHYTFLTNFHAIHLKRTTKDHYSALSSRRDGIPASLFREEKLAFDSINDRWLIPIKNGKPNLVNIHTWDANDAHPRAQSTADCSLHLFRGDKINKSGPIWICEGYWDALALILLFRKLKMDLATNSVVAVPGANVFKTEWVKLFNGREVFFLYDNDSAGQDGQLRAAKLLEGKAKSVRTISWPSDESLFPEGYDLRDFILPRLKSAKKAWAELRAMLSVGERKLRAAKIKRETFKSVLTDFRKHAYMDKAMEDALAVMFAVVFSVRVPGNPLWLFLVSPPGGGKSLLIQSFDDPDYVISKSRITRQTLASGMQREGEDPSLLPQLRDKCLMVKDFTVIKTLPEQAQEELYAILRDAYDGKVNFPFGNGVTAEYDNLNFSMVAGVTPIIHAESRTHLGERFLKMELLSAGNHDQRAHILRSMSNTQTLIQAEQELKACVTAFLSRKLDPRKLPVIPANVREKIISLGEVCESLRTTVERSGKRLMTRPITGIATRLCNQLVRLARCLAFVLDSPINENIYRLIRTVAFHTVIGWPLEIVTALSSSQRKTGPIGLSSYDISRSITVSPKTIDPHLWDMLETGILNYELIPPPGGGHPERRWTLTSDFSAKWKACQYLRTPTPISRSRRRPSRGRKAKS